MLLVQVDWLPKAQPMSGMLLQKPWQSMMQCCMWMSHLSLFSTQSRKGFVILSGVVWTTTKFPYVLIWSD
jgi:hypothetical protein